MLAAGIPAVAWSIGDNQAQEAVTRSVSLRKTRL
jgi:hypothetical protein